MSWQDERADFIADTLQTLRHIAEASPAPRIDWLASEPDSDCESEGLRELSRFISTRVAAVRNRQRLLHIESEACYELEMHRLRTAVQQWAQSA
jgi:hypothetical protein